MSDEPTRVFVQPEELPDQTPDRPLTLPEDAAHYVRDVLRLERGADLEVLDGTGRLLRGRVQSVSDREVTLAVGSDTVTDRAESPCEVTLHQAIPKGDRWRMVLEKTTELGVHRLVPLETHRTVVEIPDERLESKMTRWQRIMGNAARQCDRSRTPTLEAPHSLSSTIEQLEPSVESFVLHPTGEQTISDALPADEAPEIAFWIGPEGGFTDEELGILQQAGIEPVTFGPRILRSETAGITAVTAAQLMCGDL